MASDKKEEEIYGENAIEGIEIENLESPFKFDPNEITMKKMASMQQQNPLGDMVSGIMQNLTGGMGSEKRPKKLTLSGPVGDSHISIEITDSFTASMAHDIINRIMDEKRGRD